MKQTELKFMTSKNKRMKNEYRRGLGFDPREYISAPDRNSEHENNNVRTPQRGDIWFANLGSHPYSSVQSGCRPVIVISNNIGNTHSDTVNIILMTRHLKKPDLPCHTEITPDHISDKRQLLDTSMVLAEQVTTISKYALRNYVGKIEDTTALSAINTAVASQLGIKTAKEM